MMMRWVWATLLFLTVIAWGSLGAINAATSGVFLEPMIGVEPALYGWQKGCGSDDARVGHVAVLESRAHGVSGTARITDNCTIVIEDFNFDGQGIDVHVYGFSDTSFMEGVSLSGDLLRDTPYVNETLIVTLPAGVTLDDVPVISIWCVPAGANFGEGVFGPADGGELDPIDAVGTLVQGVECVLFSADAGGLYLLEMMGDFQVGDRVRVQGLVNPACVTMCLEGDGCIQGNMIEAEIESVGCSAGMGGRGAGAGDAILSALCALVLVGAAGRRRSIAARV